MVWVSKNNVFSSDGTSRNSYQDTPTKVEYLGKLLTYLQLLTNPEAKFKNEINAPLAQELYQSIEKNIGF